MAKSKPAETLSIRCRKRGLTPPRCARMTGMNDAMMGAHPDKMAYNTVNWNLLNPCTLSITDEAAAESK